MLAHPITQAHHAGNNYWPKSMSPRASMGGSPGRFAANPATTAPIATPKQRAAATRSSNGKLEKVDKTVPKELRVKVVSLMLDGGAKDFKRSAKRRKLTPVKCLVKVEVSALKPAVNTMSDIDNASRLLCDVRCAMLEPGTDGTGSLELKGLQEFVYNANTLLVKQVSPTGQTRWSKTLAKNYIIRITISFLDQDDMTQILDYLNLKPIPGEETCFYVDLPSTHIPFPGQTPTKFESMKQMTSTTSTSTTIKLRASINWIANTPNRATKKVKIHLSVGNNGIGLLCPFCHHESLHLDGLVEHMDGFHLHTPSSSFDFAMPAKVRKAEQLNTETTEALCQVVGAWDTTPEALTSLFGASSMESSAFVGLLSQFSKENSLKSLRNMLATPPAGSRVSAKYDLLDCSAIDLQKLLGHLSRQQTSLPNDNLTANGNLEPPDFKRLAALGEIVQAWNTHPQLLDDLFSTQSMSNYDFVRELSVLSQRTTLENARILLLSPPPGSALKARDGLASCTSQDVLSVISYFDKRPKIGQPQITREQDSTNQALPAFSKTINGGRLSKISKSAKETARQTEPEPAISQSDAHKSPAVTDIKLANIRLGPVVDRPAPQQTEVRKTEVRKVNTPSGPEASHSEADVPVKSVPAAAAIAANGATTLRAPVQAVPGIAARRSVSASHPDPAPTTRAAQRRLATPQVQANATPVVSEGLISAEPLANIPDDSDADMDSLFEETLIADPPRSDSGIDFMKAAEGVVCAISTEVPATKQLASRLASPVEQPEPSAEPWVNHGLPPPVLTPYTVPKLAKPHMVLYKEVTLRPLKEGEQVVEYEEQIDETWSRMRQDQIIDADKSMTFAQKSLMKRWNHHMLEERLNGNKFLGDALIRFTRANKSWLNGEKEHFQELMRFLGSMRADKIIKDKDVAKCIAVVRGTEKEEDESPASRVAARAREKAKSVAQKKAAPGRKGQKNATPIERIPIIRDELPPQQEAKYVTVRRNDWASSCSCGLQVEDLSQLIMCSNPLCDNPEYHLKCVGMESRVPGWRCVKCSIMRNDEEFDFSIQA